MKTIIKTKTEEAVDKLLGYPVGGKVKLLVPMYGMEEGTITTISETPSWDKAPKTIWIVCKSKEKYWKDYKDVCTNTDSVTRV